MADINIGDVTARLRADLTQFNQGIAEAVQRLQSLNQAASTIRQQQGTQQQSTTQLAQAYQALAQAITQQSQAYSQTQQAVTAYRQQQDALSESLRKQRDEHRRVTEEAGKAGMAWRSMLTIAGGIGIATGLGELVSQLGQFARSVVDVGTRLSALRATFGALANSTAAGIQQFNQLFDVAQRLGVAFEPLARGWRTLTAAASQTSLPLADQQRLLTALATEARRVGASNQELERAILAVGQMASKGKVSMEELRQQLGEALPTALAAAARGMGRTTEELTKLVETGRVSFVPFAQALTRGFENLQQRSGDFASTSRQTFNQLSNAMLAFKDAIATNVLPELERIARVTRGILETATAIIRRAGQGPARPEGPTISDFGGNAAQQQEAARLSTLIQMYEQQLQATNMTPVMRQTREEQLTRAREQRDELLQVLRLTQDQATAQAKVTEEANKTADTLARQKAFAEEFAKATAQLAKDTEAFRAKAALAPERLGRPTGATEDVTTFNKNLQDIVGKQLEDLAALVQQRGDDIQLTNEQRQALARLDAQYGQLGKAITSARDAEQARHKAAREAEQAREKAARDAAREAEQAAQQAIRDQETYQAAIDKVRISIVQQQEQGIEALRRLGNQYQRTKKESDALTANTLADQLQGTDFAEEASQIRDLVTDIARIENQIPQLLREAAASAAIFEESQATSRFTAGIRGQLQRLRAPADERTDARIRAQAAREGRQLTDEDEALLKQIRRQEQLNTMIDAMGRIGNSAASILTNSLLSIADGTRTVSEAFREMGRQILQTIAQITLNEGFSILLRLGLGAVAGALTGGAGATVAAPAGPTSAGGTGFEILMAQGGAVVNRPTAILAGENPAMNPEVVLNRPQFQSLMQSAMRAGPSAGGQAANGAPITIINVSSREQGEARAAQERALGKQVVLNYIMDDLAAGASSKVGQMIRMGGHR